MNDKSLLQSGMRSLVGGVFGLALAMGYSGAASAAEYTAKEKANIEAVRGLYAALDQGGVDRNLSTAIVGIANKYIAPGYIQHSANAAGKPPGREGFIAIFQGGGAPGGGAGGPPQGAGAPPPGAGAPAGGPPGGGAPPQGAGAPGAGGQGAGRAQGSKVWALMADGDYVIRVSGLGTGLIWNMFRVENGLLAEHWDSTGGELAGGQGGQRGAAPGGAPTGGAGGPPAQ